MTTILEDLYAYRFSILLILAIVIITRQYTLLQCLKRKLCYTCKRRTGSYQKCGFINRTSQGVYYDTDSLSFATSEDRTRALDEVIALMKSGGFEYTRDQLQSLNDSFLLMILEPEDELEKTMLRARVVFMADPSYKQAMSIVRLGLKNNNTLASPDERNLVFTLISKYFTMLNTPVVIPLTRWTDFLLIRTFRTLQLPSALEYSA